MGAEPIFDRNEGGSLSESLTLASFALISAFVCAYLHTPTQLSGPRVNRLSTPEGAVPCQSDEEDGHDRLSGCRSPPAELSGKEKGKESRNDGTDGREVALVMTHDPTLVKYK